MTALFCSFPCVDPAHDSVPQLRKFADRFNANHDTWWFVTGDRQEIYDFAFNELKASLADKEVDTAFLHTENFFLLDSIEALRMVREGLLLKEIAGSLGVSEGAIKQRPKNDKLKLGARTISHGVSIAARHGLI